MKKVILCLIVFLGFAFLFKNSIYAEPKDPIKEKADSFWSICDGLEQKGKANFIYPKYVYRLKPFTVGLISTNKVFTLKATFILGLNDEKLKKEAKKKLFLIRDTIILLLSSARLSNVSHIEGKCELRNLITELVNGVLETGKVTNVYFDEFLIESQGSRLLNERK